MNDTITMTTEEFDLFVQLMYTITPQDNGSYIIDGEYEDLIQECNDLIDRVS